MMKLLKILAGFIFSVLILMVIVSFIIPVNFRVVHEQFIKAPPEAIYEQLITPGNWKNWSYWIRMDPGIRLTYNDIKSGPGAAYSWTSDKKEMGSGSMTIIGSETNHYVNIRLDFECNGSGLGEYIITPEPGGAKVLSSFNTDTKGVIKKWSSRLFGRPIMKKSFMVSMQNLEKYLAEHLGAVSAQADTSGTISVPEPPVPPTPPSK